MIDIKIPYICLYSGKQARLAGIYAFYNTINHKYYIGSAYKFGNRRNHHLTDLRYQRHDNEHLQRAFDKYGEKAFIFIILEYCDINIILIREQFYLDKYDVCNPEKGYNFAKIAGSGAGCNINKFKVISPKGLVIEGENVLKFCDDNNINYGGFIQMMNKNLRTAYGWRIATNEMKHGDIIDLTPFIRADKEKRKSLYKFYFNNELTETTNLKEFCKINKLPLTTMKYLYHGQIEKEYRGYFSAKSPEITEMQRNYFKPYCIFEHRNGNRIKVEVVDKFIKNNGIHNRVHKTYGQKDKFINDWRIIEKSENYGGPRKKTSHSSIAV